MAKIRKVLNESQILKLEEIRGCDVGRNKESRYRLTKEEWSYIGGIIDSVVDEVSETLPNDYNKAKPFVLSAWNNDTGLMMDIDEYCEFYNLPRQNISSYKLISHTGVPFYNIVFKESVEAVEDFDYRSVIKGVIKSIKVKPYKHTSVKRSDNSKFTRLVYSDTHIAMDTDSEGTAMYATVWDSDEIMESMYSMCREVVNNKVGNTLYIDELGDFLDGFDGYTTRGGHSLPQNMTNEGAFELALTFKLQMLNVLAADFEKIVCNNICNDNHAGSFGAVLNHAFKVAAEIKFNNVVVNNIQEFIGHYIVGNHAFVISHGKDKKSLKFGFKPQLDSKQIEKIDHYLKYNDVYRKAKYIEFGKGDSHQMLFDYTTSQDFDYFNYPALSPSSEWVGTNFKKGLRGFVIQQVHYNRRDKIMIPVIID
tara:strand:- start:8096 stop:9361 length:1266 start_codon:yes stop_codon:yes gene_type:complete